MAQTYNLKQVILMRNDLKLPKGKACAQAAHASVDAVLKSDEKVVQEWKKSGMAKIVLKVADEKELVSFFQAAKDSSIVASLITDAGHTVVEPGTKTCVGLGPAKEEELDALVGELSLF